MKKNSLLFVLVFVVVFGCFLLPGPKAANDFPYSSAESVKEGFSLPQVWSSRGNGMGRYILSTLWAWPVDFLYGLGAAMNIDFSVLERLIGIFPTIIIGAFAISKLLRRHGIDGTGNLAGILVYMINSYLILLIDGGQLSLGIAYAWLPLAFLAWELSIEEGLKKKILAGISVSFLGFLDLRFVYVFLLIIFLKFAYELFFLSLRSWPFYVISWIKTGFVTALIMIGLHSFWILPSVLAKAPEFPVSYIRSEQASFLSFANLGHSMLLLQPHWFKNIFGRITALRPEFILIPFLVFLTPILKRKDKKVGFWLLVGIVGIFLVKGSNPPLQGVYNWLFTNIIGFSLFRDPSKFFILVALSYSVLVGIGITELVRKISWFVKIIPLGLVLYFLVLTQPVWLGKMTGMFSAPPYQKELGYLEKTLRADNQWSRVLWIPIRSSFGHSSPTHIALTATDLTEIRPFIAGNVGTYEIFNFIREAPFMGQLFDVAGISHIVYPYPDDRRGEMNEDDKNYYWSFLGQLSKLDWLKVVQKSDKVPILKTAKHQDHFFVSTKLWWVVGSDRIYWDLAAMGNFDLSKNAIIFAEKTPSLLNMFSTYPNSNIILYDKNLIDLSASFLDSDNFVFPAKKLNLSPEDSGRPRSNQGWWKRESIDFLNWRHFLQEKYGLDNLDFDLLGGWAIAEGNSKLQVTNDKFKSGRILLARVMESSKGGVIRFYQGKKLIGEVNTLLKDPNKVEVKLSGYKEIPDKFFNYDAANVRWFEIGELVDNGEITIESDGDINVVNALASIDRQKWSLIQERVKDIVDRGKVLVWNELADERKKDLFNIDENVVVDYEKKSPTKYLVKIAGVREPVVLVFSEGYDPLWYANGKQSLPVYGFLNGFEVEKDGVYEIFYTPQKYIVPGLVVSGLSLALIIIAFIKLRGKKSV